MAASKAAGARKDTGGQPLPKITVARVQEALVLVEKIYQENLTSFIQAGQDFRDRHRGATSRPLTAVETAQIAAGLSTTLADAREQIEDADLTHHDEPQPQEYLLAAGVATAPAFFNAVLRLTALMELPDDVFETAREGEALDAAIAEHVRELDSVDIEDARKRAATALERLARGAGMDPGKAWGVVGKTVWQALVQAMATLTDQPATSLSTPSTPSAAPGTAATHGADEKSSTTPPGAKPSV